MGNHRYKGAPHPPVWVAASSPKSMDRLRDALRVRDMDVVVFHSPDRLARKAVYQGLVLEEMEKAGVPAEFLNYPLDDSP